jgi:DNA-binding NtrC family response regulator
MRGKAILCVDDEAIILLALIQELRRAFGSSCRYERALDAESALEAVEDLARDGIEVVFIISDWLMPGIKGDALIEIVKERHPKIKAILITGQADDEAIERVKKFASVVAVFRKPWSSKALIEAIAGSSDLERSPGEFPPGRRML